MDIISIFEIILLAIATFTAFYVPMAMSSTDDTMIGTVGHLVWPCEYQDKGYSFKLKGIKQYEYRESIAELEVLSQTEVDAMIDKNLEMIRKIKRRIA